MPGDDLTVCVEIADVRVGLFHGHQVRGQGKVQGRHDAQAGTIDRSERPICSSPATTTRSGTSGSGLAPGSMSERGCRVAAVRRDGRAGCAPVGVGAIDVDAGTVGDIRIV